MIRPSLWSLLPLVLIPLSGCSEECDCVAPLPVVTGVVVTGAPTVPLRVGNRVVLSAQVQATGFLYDQGVIWRTLSPTVVEVDAGGLATGVGAGEGTVVAIARVDTTKRGSVTIRVE